MTTLILSDLASDINCGGLRHLGPVQMKPMIVGFRDEAKLDPIWREVPHTITRIDGRIVERRLDTGTDATPSRRTE